MGGSDFSEPPMLIIVSSEARRGLLVGVVRCGFQFAVLLNKETPRLRRPPRRWTIWRGQATDSGQHHVLAKRHHDGSQLAARTGGASSGPHRHRIIVTTTTTTTTTTRTVTATGTGDGQTPRAGPLGGPTARRERRLRDTGQAAPSAYGETRAYRGPAGSSGPSARPAEVEECLYFRALPPFSTGRRNS
jgi:hypothetical protein